MNSTPEILIRPLLPADQAGWLRMRGALWPDCSSERHAIEMDQLNDCKDAVVLIAIDPTGHPCGFAEVSVRRDHVDGATAVPTAYLEGWYVEPERRGVGVGGRLLAAVERWALERDLRELASDAELYNEPGIEAHLASGFRETFRAVHFIKALG